MLATSHNRVIKDALAWWMSLQGHVGVLARDVVQLLGAQDLQILAETTARLLRFNDIVNKATLGDHHGIGKAFRVFGRMFFDISTMVENFDGTFGSHDSHLGTRPRVVDIAAQVLGGHDIIGTTIGLAGNDGHLGDIGLCVSKQKLGAVTDNSSKLLFCSGQESGNIDKGDQGNIKGVTETNEAGCLGGGFNIETSCQSQGIVGNNTHRVSFHTSKARNDVLGHVWLDFE
mmetsp:Transcript_16517/g.31397  ORF Transcript_16517/g.31397 Transcript_16517/m.31397 type:complete len:230 (-) Transcript_16517:1153-1842(-)